MLLVLALWVVGIFFSAFFSGSETGFYRVNRVRLAMDTQDGGWNLRGLLWLTNNPAMFVATSLVGNNLANYCTSMAMVLGTQRIVGDGSWLTELSVTVLLSPILFVYGELLPKHLFFSAPNRMLRLSSRLFLFFTVVFAPASALLWGLARLLQSFIGQAPERMRSSLARKELQKVLEEGHEVGLLRPTQRRLAQSMFAVAGWPAMRFAVPIGRLPSVRLGAKREEAQRLAERHQLPFVLVMEPNGRRLMGYVKTLDLYKPHGAVDYYRPLVTLSNNASLLSALIELKSRGEMVARLNAPDQRTIGLITTRRLTELLMQPQ